MLVGDAARAAIGELPSAAVEHALDVKERVRWERDPGYRLLVVRVPRREAPSALGLDTVPVGLIVTEQDVAIVSAVENDVTRELRAHAERARTTDVLVALLRVVARSFAETVDDVEQAIDVVEQRLARSLRNTEVLELLRFQKALVHHTSALRALMDLLERLPQRLGLDESDARGLDDVVVELRQALEVADLERATLGDTMDAFASIISNNLNDVMRVLTAVAVVLTPPVTIASLWGMNVPLPFAERPAAFWILLLGSTLASLLVALVLRFRRWL